MQTDKGSRLPVKCDGQLVAVSNWEKQEGITRSDNGVFHFGATIQADALLLTGRHKKKNSWRVTAVVGCSRVTIAG